MSSDRPIPKPKSMKRQLFPEKLWDLVNQPASGIQWSDDGKHIEIEKDRLEKFDGTKFRSSNFDSFIRQLHFYGFRKSGTSYYHDKFQRDQPEALTTMRRKYSNLPLLPSKRCNANSPCGYTSSNTSQNSNDAISLNGSLLSTMTSNKSTNYVMSNNNNNGEVIDLSSNQTRAKKSPIKEVEKSVYASVGLNEPCIAIDYSSTGRKRSLASPTKNSMKRLATETCVVDSKKDCNIKSATSIATNSNATTKEIPIYCLKPTTLQTTGQSIDSGLMNLNLSNTNFSFVTLCPDLIKTTSDKKSIRISIPQELRDTDDERSWPKTLVLENCWNGHQNLLTAYYTYY